MFRRFCSMRAHAACARHAQKRFPCILSIIMDISIPIPYTPVDANALVICPANLCVVAMTRPMDIPDPSFICQFAAHSKIDRRALVRPISIEPHISHRRSVRSRRRSLLQPLHSAGAKRMAYKSTDKSAKSISCAYWMRPPAASASSACRPKAPKNPVFTGFFGWRSHIAYARQSRASGAVFANEGAGCPAFSITDYSAPPSSKP